MGSLLSYVGVRVAGARYGATAELCATLVQLVGGAGGENRCPFFPSHFSGLLFVTLPPSISAQSLNSTPILPFWPEPF